MVAASPLYNDDFGFFSDEEDELEPTNPFNHLPFPIMPLKSSELNVLIAYDGTKDARDWLQQLGNLATQFGWSSEDTATAAKHKMIGDGHKWLRSQRLMGWELDSMEDIQAVAAAGNNPATPFQLGFRNAFLERFDELLTEVAATLAVTQLKQEDKETVDQYYDRVVYALDMKNHMFTTAQKREPSYRQMQETELYSFFGAGLKPALRAATLGAAQPPKTLATLLTSARTVERERKTPTTSTTSTTSSSVAAVDTSSSSATDVIADLVKKVEALTTKSTNATTFAGTCYGCGKRGHKRDVCRSSGRGRGRGNFQTSNRGGQNFRGHGNSSNYRGNNYRGNNYRGNYGGYSNNNNYYNQGQQQNTGGGWQQQQNVNALEQQQGQQDEQPAWCFQMSGNDYGGH